MPSSSQEQPFLPLDIPSGRSKSADPLVFIGSEDRPLSPAQKEFNRLVKQLKNARDRQEQARSQLDHQVKLIENEVLPVLGKLNLLRGQLLVEMRDAMNGRVKITKRRRGLLEEKISIDISDLLEQPFGLDEEVISRLTAIAKELDPEDDDDFDDPDFPFPRGNDEFEESDLTEDEVGELLERMKFVASVSGLDLDISGIDLSLGPEEIEIILKQRMDEAIARAEAELDGGGRTSKRPARKRKPSKAQLERERLAKQMEEAKSKDIKALYKQLAKALHPDLEQDPEKKLHREQWMQRLTGAYADGNLHEMLMIEVEWLGEESGNLSQAGDEKLRVYSMVLKEQLTDIRMQTQSIRFEPQYMILHDFFGISLGHRGDTSSIRRGIKQEMREVEALIQKLREGGTAARLFLNQQADEYDYDDDMNPFGYY